MKQQQGWKSGLLRCSEWFSRLVYINLLWIGFTLLGLVVFGFFPATIAMFAVLRKWVQGNLYSNVFKEFWTFYKTEFVKSNMAGLVWAVVGYVLYIDLTVYEFGDSGYEQAIQIFIYIVTAIYLIALAFFFPVYVQYEMKWFSYIKTSALMLFSFPLRAIWMLLIGYGITFIMLKFPGVIPFLLGSAIAYLWLMITLPVFMMNKNKEFKQ